MSDSVMKRSIPVYRPWMGEEEALATHAPILSGWVTQGPEVLALEREFAEYVGAPQAVAVANCTVGLHLALLVAGVGPGDEVITASHSFIATANAVRYVGATPVFADIQLETLNLDPSQLEELIGERTRAILVVHQIGMPADLRAILAIAARHGIPVIEDAACAVGSEILWNGQWEKIGRPHGDIACFSFHPRKLLTTGDGGMLTTARADWAARARHLRQHAMSVSDTVRHQSTQVIRESYLELGYNYRLTDIQAAVGRVQLRRLPELLAKRRGQVEQYRTLLAPLPVSIQKSFEWARSNWQSFMVRLPAGANQAAIMQAMLDQGVATRRGIMNAHTEPAYAEGGWRCGSSGLPHSESAQSESILLPLFHTMEDSDIPYVANALANALGG